MLIVIERGDTFRIHSQLVDSHGGEVSGRMFYDLCSTLVSGISVKPSLSPLAAAAC